MKRTVMVLAASAVLGIVATGLAVAQTTTPTPAPGPAATPAPAPRPTETKSKTVEMQKAKSATGTVKSTSADSIVVAGKAARDVEWTFAVDSKTAIRKAGKAITVADLKAGDQVNVRYTEQQGKATAVAIQVRPGASAAKSPGSAEKK